MYATKETFVISLAAILIGAIAILGRARRSARAATAPELPRAVPNFRHIALAFVAAIAIWLLFFSSFFTNWSGLADSIRTYLPWLKRAGGHSPHIHPWYFYFERLAWFHPAKSPIWSEGLILVLAIIGGAVSFRRKQPLPTFIAIYTIVLTAAYSAISYKTPWCLLSFLFGMILLAGIGASALVTAISNRVGRIAVTVALLGFSAQLTHQSCRANFNPKFVADRRNPYVYAQTVPDLLNLVTKVEAIAAISPAAHNTVVKVMAPGGDYWPLPWYLRRFKNVGWYEQLPHDPFAPIIIVAAQLDARLDEKSDKKWIMVGLTESRPEKFFELYVETELWKKYVAILPPARD
jgi:predicted membrane-bound mannosyltransferase